MTTRSVRLGAAVCDQSSDLTRPIDLGAAGGNIKSETVSNGVASECCYGTLGALVKGPGGEYILSNNHVLARVNLGRPGEGIIQPGLVQDGCPVTPPTGDIVAHLSGSSPINFGSRARNKIDAAIARVVQGDVSDDILNIGPISGKVAPAVINLLVRKMGATSCLTEGFIQSIGVDALGSDGIQYTDECNSGSGTANFVDQIVVKGTSGVFAIPGDSGSLVVTTATCPQPVGLLFASDDAGDIFVNPIKEVLSHFGVSIAAGCTPALADLTVDFRQGGSDSITDYANADDDGADEAAAFATISGMSMDAVEFAMAAKARHESDLFAIKDVAGVGVGASNTSGVPSIDIYVTEDSAALRNVMPDSIEGLPVKVIVGGPIYAL
jgi:hypothetical protein